MKVLVTGAAGVLGARVVAQLRDRHEVIALSRADCELADGPAVRAVVAGHRPDAVIHLAWYAKHPAFWSAPENLASVTHALTVLEAASAAGCRRFVGAGTCAEYDWSFARLVEDTTPCRPRTLYGAAKLAAYTVGERYAATRGLSFAWARYGFLFGGDGTRLIDAALAALRAGHDFPCSRGEQIRDFLHVDDAAAATIALVESELAGAVNVGSGEPVSVRAVVETIAELAGGAGRPRFGARPAGDEPPELVLDTAKLAAIWRPPHALRERIARMVRG